MSPPPVSCSAWGGALGEGRGPGPAVGACKGTRPVPLVGRRGLGGLLAQQRRGLWAGRWREGLWRRGVGRTARGSCKPGTFTSGQVGRTSGSVSGCTVFCAHPAPPVPCLPGFSPGAPDHFTTQQVEGGGTGVGGGRAGPGISLTLPCFSSSRCWRVPKGASMAISVPGQADPQGWAVWPAGGPQKMAVWCTGSPGGWREGASDTLTCRCQVGGGGVPVVVDCPVTGSHHAGHLGAGLSAQRERDSGPLVLLGWTGGGDAPFGCRAQGGGGLAGLLLVSVSPGAGGEAPGPPAAPPSPRDPAAPSGWAGLTFPSSAHLCPALAFT